MNINNSCSAKNKYKKRKYKKKIQKVLETSEEGKFPLDLCKTRDTQSNVNMYYIYK